MWDLQVIYEAHEAEVEKKKPLKCLLKEECLIRDSLKYPVRSQECVLKTSNGQMPKEALTLVFLYKLVESFHSPHFALCHHQRHLFDIYKYAHLTPLAGIFF